MEMTLHRHTAGPDVTSAYASMRVSQGFELIQRDECLVATVAAHIGSGLQAQTKIRTRRVIKQLTVQRLIKVDARNACGFAIRHTR